MERLEQIEKYLDDELTAEERAGFEAEMEIDAELKEEVSMIQLTRDAIRSAGVREVVEAAQKDFLMQRKPQGKQLFLGRQIFRYAAGILILFTFWAGYWLNGISSENILTSAALGYIEPVYRSTEAEQEEFRMKYQNQEYAEILKRLPEVNSPTAKQYFLSSMAAFEQKEYSLAADYLKEAKRMDSNKVYEHEIAYYTGLIALGQKDYQTAFEMLSAVKNDPQNPYSKAVSRLMMLKLRYLLFFKA